jgi:tetraacyldisaccharide 4'-kinase
MTGGARQQYLALVRGRRRGLWPTLQRLALAAASVPYGLAVRARNVAFNRGLLRQHRAGVPVISVGNLTTGGTGKTPCVEYVARFYRQRDLRVAILSRGYGADNGPNDEALVLEENLPDVPHLQGADRVRLAQTAIEELDSEVLVLDDGFQHRRLARNLDLVLIDVTDPWGGGWLLPRGLLREPRSSLRRAHLILLTRCDQVDRTSLDRLRQSITALSPGRSIVETTHHPEELLDSEGERTGLERLQARPIAAFCGIGNPEAFRRTLLDLGAELCDFRTFPDHHRYRREDVEELRCWAGGLPHNAMVVTTQKDLVKLRLRDLSHRYLTALCVRLRVEAGQDIFHRHLEAVLPHGDPRNREAEL